MAKASSISSSCSSVNKPSLIASSLTDSPIFIATFAILAAFL